MDPSGQALLLRVVLDGESQIVAVVLANGFFEDAFRVSGRLHNTTRGSQTSSGKLHQGLPHFRSHGKRLGVVSLDSLFLVVQLPALRVVPTARVSCGLDKVVLGNGGGIDNSTSLRIT